MSQISSINFKKSFAINTEHNDRTLPPNYLIDNEKGAECNRTAQQARELKTQIIDEAIKAYTKSTGQKFQAKSYEWSAVVNLKPDTTMDVLERLSKHFSYKYGFQCYQIAIHRDEGHIDENGEKQINHHAHLEFITLDKQTGKNNYRRELITPKVLRQIQTEVAEILGMQRGVDKRISKAERIEPRQYAKQKEVEKQTTKALKQELKAQALTAKQIKEQFETYRKEHANKGLDASFFKELSIEKKNMLEQKDVTQDDLDLLFTRLDEKNKGILGVNKGAVIDELKEIIRETAKEHNELKSIANQAIKGYDEAIAQEQATYEAKRQELERHRNLLDYEREQEAKINENKKNQEIGYHKNQLDKQYQEKFNALSLEGVAQHFRLLWEKAEAKIKEQAQKFADEIGSLKEKVKEYTNKIAFQDKKIENLEKENERINASLKQACLEKAQVFIQNDELRGQICSLSDENKKLKEFIDRSKEKSLKGINEQIDKVISQVVKEQDNKKQVQHQRNNSLSR